MTGRRTIAGSMRLEIGTVLGPYRIQSLLGEGGIGEVYAAFDSRLERQVALKLLREGSSTDPRVVSRFEQEAKAIAAIQHANIVTIHSVESVDGLRFLTMELVEGATLAEHIEGRESSASEILQIGSQVSSALEAAHAKGVVHRDLKPSNILLRETSSGFTVKVLDFGMARVRAPQPSFDQSTSPTLTVEGTFLGTPHYVSPEQARGQEVDERSDIFSLGVVLYQLATGRLPFVGDSVAEILSAVLRDSPEPVEQSRSDLGPGLAAIVERCLSKARDDRYPSATAVRRELETIAASLSSAEGTLHATTTLESRRPAPPAAASKTSIAILPVQLLTETDEARALASGLGGEISDALTRIGGVRVVSRLPSSLASTESTDFVGIARQFGTDYVLFMTLLHSGDRLRVKSELHRAPEGFMSWSSTSEVALDDVFSLQQSIAEAVAKELGGELFRSEYLRIREQPTTSLDAWALTQHSANLVISGEDYPNWDAALDYARRALVLDPEFGPAWARLAALLGERAAFLLTQTMEQDVAEALDAADRAENLSPYDPYVQMNSAQAWILCGQIERGRRALAKAEAQIPHDSLLWFFRCCSMVYSGGESEARETLAVCSRIRDQSPKNPLAPQFAAMKAIAHFRLGEHGRTVERLLGTFLGQPRLGAALWPIVAASLGELGRLDEARQLFDVVRAEGYCPRPGDIEPNFDRLSGGRRDVADAFLQGLRKAGIVPVA